MKKTKLMLGDNISSLKKLPDNSIDSVVTDPPYGLSFMNKKWDYDVPSVDFWKEVYRVLKPGGHILSFGGTRTYHRMVINIEDAGFEIRDQIMWLYGSGFPKSHNVGLSIDKLKGHKNRGRAIPTASTYQASDIEEKNKLTSNKVDKYETKTEEAKQFEGWGTALKPANEPICLARKPLSEKSVAENVLKWKTGGINVDGCRIEGSYGSGQNEVIEGKSAAIMDKYDDTRKSGAGIKQKIQVSNPEGRFPANIILECICDEVIKGEKGEIKKSSGRDRTKHEYNSVGNMGSYDGKGTIDNYNDKGDIHTDPNCPCRLLDEQSGIVNQGHWSKSKTSGFGEFGGGGNKYEGVGPKDKTKGGASRFFYQAKVSKAERNMGLDGFEEKENQQKGHGLDRVCMNEGCGVSMLKPELCKCDEPDWRPRPKKNSHPTVKPINLMAYLCRLITPEGGIVLDPFMGSGSTGIAAQLEGFRFVGMEMDEDYFKIASARIDSYEKYKKFHKGDQGLKNGNTRMASRSDNSNSIGLGICKKKENE